MNAPDIAASATPEASTALPAPEASTADVRPYVIRTYDRWIILVLVLVIGWFIFRPLFAFSVYYRGVSFERMLELRIAEHYYRKSTLVYDKIPQGWQGWGELYLMRAMGDRSAQRTAVDIFYKGLALNPTHAPLAFDLGRSYYIGKDYAKAREAFLHSAHYAPEDVFSWDFAAWSSLHNGDVALAVKYWRQVLKIDPGNKVAHRELAIYGG
jgi:tetratricopeptide (TPR) repeat protein